MAHPKRQHSKQRTRKRRAQQKLKAKIGAVRTDRSQMGYNHRVDPVTGYYKGKQIIDVGPKEEKAK